MRINSEMITARQVAARCGVSISTVGRALANDPRISAETKARVRQAADILGYVENTPARMMRGGSSNLIGLMLPDIHNDFYATIAEAMSACCDAEGYQLAFSIANDRDAEARHVKELVSARVAGIVIVSTPTPRRETRDLLQNFPHVQLLRRGPLFQSAWFGIDDEESLRVGTAHLLELGHRRIAYIGGSTEFSTGEARVKGFRRAFAEAGIDMSGAFELLGPPSSFEFGTKAVFQLLGGKQRPTALITGAVQITQAVLDTLHRLRVSVPNDLSVVGFGDAPGFDWWGPGLTTIRMPIQELATTCGLWFLHRLKIGATSAEKHSSIVPTHLVLRGSTAHMKGEARKTAKKLRTSGKEV